jgi:DUF4097 and DUF4098 domain-containing protein YvlB
MELRVEPTDGDQATIEVDLEYWSRSEEWMDLVDAEFDIEINERSRVIEISGGRMPERNESWWRRVFGGNREISWSLDVVLRVPVDTALRLENRYGNIEVNGIRGALDIDNASGEVTVSNAGKTTIANSYGPIDVDGVDGDLYVRGSSAELRVNSVRGNADVETSYAELIVDNIEGQLRAVASSGTVRVNNVSGFAHVTNSYAPVEVHDVADPAAVLQDVHRPAHAGEDRADRFGAAELLQ